MSFQTCIIFFSLWNLNWDARNEIQACMQRKQMVIYTAKIQNAPWKWHKSSLVDLCTVIQVSLSHIIVLYELNSQTDLLQR